MKNNISSSKIYFFLLFSLNFYSFSQTPDILWQHSYGSTSNDRANAIDRTLDGGFVVAGYARENDGDVLENNGIYDFWLLKLNNVGFIEWQEAYGGSGYDYCYDAKVTLDGGFILAGASKSIDGDVTSNNGLYDCWIVKTDISGNIEWQKSYGGSESDYAHEIIQTSDLGYMVAGVTNSNDGDVTDNNGNGDFWIIKLNSLGEMEWQKCFGSNGNENASSIIQVSDGGYLVLGSSDSNGGDVSGNHGWTDYWIIKISTAGNIEWQKSFGGSEDDIAYSAIETSSHNFVIIGETYSNNGDVTGFLGFSDVWIIKVDSLGNIQWKKCYGGTNGDHGSMIQIASNGNFIFSAYSASLNIDLSENNGANDFWLVEIDTNGIIQWEKSVGGSLEDLTPEFVQTLDDNYVLAGESTSSDDDLTFNNGDFDYWVVKLGSCNTPYYADTDGDGYGDLSNDSLACNLPTGYVTDSTDCDDTNNLIYPTAEDICNTVDDNCNGILDEDVIFFTWYFDSDEDNFGDVANDSVSCFDLTGYVMDNTDCNDADAEINPDASEICNELDDNCNIEIDEGLTVNIFYLDADGDTFGDPIIFINSCLDFITGYVFDSTDCDDSNNLIYPGATEICNYLDDDCDGFVDDNLLYNWLYADADGDNYGNALVDTLACLSIPGYIPDSSDCDDTDPNIYPGAEEILNGVDDDCNGLIDEGLALENMEINTFLIYPNPAKDILFVEYSFQEDIILQLINITGQIIYSESVVTLPQSSSGNSVGTHSTQNIDISKYAGGVYFVKLKMQDGFEEKVFIKQD